MAETNLDQNYRKASALIFISAGLGVINLAMVPEVFSSAFTILVAAFTLLLIAGLGLLARQGYSWVKYLLLVMFVLGLFGIKHMIVNIFLTSIVGIINIVQTILQLMALVLLFKIPTKNKS